MTEPPSNDYSDTGLDADTQRDRDEQLPPDDLAALADTPVLDDGDPAGFDDDATQPISAETEDHDPDDDDPDDEGDDDV